MRFCPEGVKYCKENKKNIIKEIFDLSCDNDKVKTVPYNNDEYVEYLCYFFFFELSSGFNGWQCGLNN